MKKIFLSKITDYSYFLMMFFLPISLLLDNVFLAIMFLSVVFEKKHKITNKLVFYALLAFFIFTVLNGLFKTSFNIEKENYIRILPFLLIPFCLLNIENKIKIKGLYFLSIGIIIIQMNAIFGVVDYYYFTEGKKYALKNYSKVNEILNYERPYLGFFSALNIIICYNLFALNKTRLFRGLSLFLILISISLIVLISARLAIIVTILIGVIIVLNRFNAKNVFFLICILITIISFSFLTNSSLKERFIQINNDARLITWKGAKASFDKTGKNIFGSGSQENTRNDLLNYYKNYDDYQSVDEKNRFILKNYNTHSQYINELLRGGIVGFLIFFLPQILLLYYNFKKNNIFGLLLLVSIICFSLVENILDRQVGVYLYTIIFSILNITNNESFKIND